MTDDKPWTPKLLSDFLLEPDELPPYLLKDFLAADSLIVCSAPPKIGYKTWFTMAQTLVLANGTPWSLLEPTNQDGIPCLIVEAEGSTVFNRRRWRWLGKAMGIEETKQPVFWSLKENLLLNDPKWVSKITNLVKKHGIKYIVFDTLREHMAGEENSSDDMSKVTRACREIRGEMSANVVLIHHLNKGNPQFKRDIDEELRGSTTLPGAYDQHQALRPTAALGNLNLTVRSKDDEERYFKVLWTFADEMAKLEMIQVESFEAFADSLGQQIIDQMMPGEEYGRGRLKEIFHAAGAELDGILMKLIEENKIQRSPRGYVLT